MSDAYISVTIAKLPRVTEAILLSISKSCRLLWGHPDTRDRADPSGTIQTQETSKNKILSEMRTSKSVMIQLWWHGYDGIFCTYDVSSKYDILNFHLDGVGQINRYTLYDAVTSLLDKYTENIAIVVIDWTGVTAEINYEAELVAGLEYDGPFPDLLLFSYRSIKLAGYSPSEFATTPVNEHFGRVLRIEQPGDDL